MEIQNKTINPVKLAIMEKLAEYVRDNSALQIFYDLVSGLVTIFLAGRFSWWFFPLGLWFIFGRRAAWQYWQDFRGVKKKVDAEKPEDVKEVPKQELFHEMPIELLADYLLSGKSFARDPVRSVFKNYLSGSFEDQSKKIDSVKALFIANGLLTQGQNGSYVLNRGVADTKEKITDFLAGKTNEVAHNFVFRPLRPETRSNG